VRVEFGTLDLSQIESHRRNFGGRQAEGRIRVRADKLPKLGSPFDDPVQAVHFVGYERKVRDLGFPFHQVFQFRPCRVPRDLNPIVTDGASAFVVFLNFASSNLKALAMIPSNKSACILSDG
jgi:hypothetical protein